MTDDPKQPIYITPEQLERALANAAKLGAQAALAELGLNDKDTVQKMRDMSGIVDKVRFASRVIGETVIKAIVAAVMFVIVLGLAAWIRIEAR